jgi:PAS domain S-box-containing protein
MTVAPMTVALAPDFRKLFEAFPGMYVVLARDLSIVAVNDAHLVSTMRKRENVIGRNVFEAFPDNPDDPTADGVQNLRASLARVVRFRAQDQMAIQRYAIRKPEGGFVQRYWKILNSPLRGEDGTVQYIVNHAEDVTELHDLTEQQRLSAVLLRKQEELRVSQEVARIGTFEWNIETGVIEWFAGEALYGLPVGGLDSFEAWTNRIHVEDRPIAERSVRVAMETGEFNGEWRSVWPDGAAHWIAVRGTVARSAAGKPMRMVGATIDITIRKESDLLRTQLAAIVDSSDDAIISRSLDGTILSWNTSAERIFGYSAEEVVGKGLMLLVPPDKIEEEEVAIAERLRRGEGVDHIESVRVTKDGRRIDVSITLSPMRDGSGKVFAASMICRDITAQKHIEEQAALANQELETFSYSVSHDLRAPLRGIDGWSLALKEDFGDKLNERGLEYIDRVRSETQRMGNLIDDLLRLSSITQAQVRPTRVNLSDLALAAEVRLREASPVRNVEFVIEPGLYVRGDSGLLNAALTNLIDNAWKFTGKLPAARIHFGRTEKDGLPVFFLGDNGAGFDMAYASKLFSPFQRAHKTSEFPGTGVGLATVQRVMHRHGGRIWVESRIDLGTTFFFTLESCL